MLGTMARQKTRSLGMLGAYRPIEQMNRFSGNFMELGRWEILGSKSIWRRGSFGILIAAEKWMVWALLARMASRNQNKPQWVDGMGTASVVFLWSSSLCEFRDQTGSRPIQRWLCGLKLCRTVLIGNEHVSYGWSKCMFDVYCSANFNSETCRMVQCLLREQKIGGSTYIWRQQHAFCTYLFCCLSCWQLHVQGSRQQRQATSYQPLRTIIYQPQNQQVI